MMSRRIHHLFALAELVRVVEIGHINDPLQVVGLGKPGDDLVHLVANLLMAFERDHVGKTAALGHFEQVVLLAGGLVGDVFDEQENEDVISWESLLFEDLLGNNRRVMAADGGNRGFAFRQAHGVCVSGGNLDDEFCTHAVRKDGGRGQGDLLRDAAPYFLCLSWRRARSETGPRRWDDRELHVFRLIGQGLSSRRIADDLYLSLKTIETHRENIKHKLGLHHSAELIHYATQWVESGLVPHRAEQPAP